MVTLPSTDKVTYSTPQPAQNEALVSGYSGAAEGLKAVGSSMLEFGQEEAEKQDNLQKSYADSQLLTGQVKVLDSLKDEKDFTKIPGLYESGMREVQAGAAASISSNSARQQFNAAASQRIAGGMDNVLGMARQKRNDQGFASGSQQLDSLGESYQTAPDANTRVAVSDQANHVVSAMRDSGFIDDTKAYEMKKSWTETQSTLKFLSRPPEEQFKILDTATKGGAAQAGQPGAGFDRSMQAVFANEGGHVNIDGSSGAPAIYGINAKWHPAEYAEAKRLTDAQGEAAGKAYASGFYKKNYWDADGIANLPLNTQTIVFDGVVNHTSSFGDQLVAAAKNGATPTQLIEMRQAEYERLAKVNPDKYAASFPGWLSRLDKLQTDGAPALGKTGTEFDFIAPEKKVALLDQYRQNVVQMDKMKISDPMSYAKTSGLAPVEPLNFTDQQGLKLQLAQRVNAAQTMQQKFGSPPAMFTNDEAKQFSTALDQMPPAQKLAYLNQFRDDIGNTGMYSAALQQIRPDSPVTAMAGMYLGLKDNLTTEHHWFSPNATVAPEYVAQRLIEGEDLLNPAKAEKKENGVGKVFPMPTDSKNGDALATRFSSQVGEAFRNRPEQSAQAYQAVRAFYASEMARKGDYSGVLNPDVANHAIKSVIGDTTTHAGHMVIPPWGMSGSSFLDKAQKKFNEVKRENNLQRVGWSDVTLENTGRPGTYRLQVGAGYLSDATHQPITIVVGQ